MTTQEKNKQIALAFMDAVGCGDTAVLQQLMAPGFEAICTGTCMLSGSRKAVDVLAAAGLLGSLMQQGIKFEALNVTAEEDRVACELQGHSILVNGDPYNNQYHFLFKIRDGKVYLMKEYMDTKLVDDALGPLIRSASAA